MTAVASITAPDSVRQHRRAAAAATPQHWVSRHLRHLERWVAWSIAVFAGLAACALAAFTLSYLQTRSLGSPGEFMAHAGLLGIFPLLLAKGFGAVMRGPVEAIENGRIDNSTALYNKEGFTVHGDKLLAACQRDNRPLSVAVFDCADLLEVRSIYGSRITRELMARIARKLTSLSADHGLAARTGRAEFSVVLPGLGREKALAAIARVLGSPLRIELDAGDSEIVLVPNFLVETAGCDTTGVDEIHQELRRELAQIGDNEQLRRNYLRRERERHSRPMGVAALRGAQPPTTRGVRLQLVPAMAAPLVAG